MRNSILILFAFLFFFGCSRTQPPLRHVFKPSCKIYDMKQARCIDEAELVRRLGAYRVVFVGDHHDSASMHRVLAKLIGDLSRSGRHVTLANEWFTPEDDALLARYAAGAFDGNFTEAVGWKKKAGYPFASYAPIYAAVRKGGGSLYGINMSKRLQKAISDNNDTNISTAQRRFAEGLDMNLTAHKAMLSPFFAHCHAEKRGESAEACTRRMYRVQVAWDSYMGKEAAKLAKTLGTRSDMLIVFAGAMHLEYGLGINARFARLSREPFVTILPVPQGETHADVGEADYLLFYPRDAQ